MNLGIATLVAATLCVTGASIPFSAEAAASDTTEATKKEKKVCRTERSTGSLTRSRRICMTQAEWDELSRSTKQDIDDMQRHGGAIPRVQGGMGATAGSG